MRPIGSAASLEKRRRRAVTLAKEKTGIREIARRVGASPGSVHRWIQDWKAHGEAALVAKPVPGRPPKLTTKQRAQVERRLLAGAMANGFPTELWTLARIAALIRRECGIRYHPSHLCRVLHAWRWSCQTPERRAIQRDAEAIAHWKRYRWPAIKKNSTTWCPPGVPR
ncbi:MAG: IS630 family transposase [Gemmatimonadaceae bacterium]